MSTRTMLAGYSGPFRKVLATNSTDASFTSKIPTITEPTGTGIIDFPGPAMTMVDSVVIMPFGVGSNDQTFDMRVLGWRPLPLTPATPATESTLWIPELLLGISCTLTSSVVGVAASPIVAANLFVDVITVSYGIGIVSNPPINTYPNRVILALEGYSKLEFIFDMTGATSGNALIAEQ